MAVLDEFISRLFVSLEVFFQKGTELDVFEDFVFSYKIKLESVEKCLSDFLATFIQLENDFQSVIKDCIVSDNDHWKLYAVSSQQLHEQPQNNVQDENVISDNEKSQIHISQESSEMIETTVIDLHMNVVDDTCIELQLPIDIKQTSIQPLQQQPQQLEDILNANEISKCQNSTTVLSETVASAKNSTLRIVNNGSISTSGSFFKCNMCLRKFRTIDKLNKHACKKLNGNNNDDKIAAQKSIKNCEIANNTNCEDMNIDESTTLSTNDNINENDNKTQLDQQESTLLQQSTQSILQSSSTSPTSVIIISQLQSKQNTEINSKTITNEDPDLPVYSCALCCTTFLEKSQWDCHVCKDKEGTANGKRVLVANRSSLEERRWFVCGFCSETYRSLGRIMHHLVRCSTGPYPCEVCSNTFTTRSELNYHKKKQHKGVESFFCSDCGLGFKLRTSLQKHLINRHENFQGEYHCDVSGCQLVFPKKILLTHHKINEHRMERKYLCQVCGNKFYNRCSLSSHLETHSNKKQFFCPICCRVLKTKEKLTLHIRTHTGERPFSCTICGKSFIAKSKLEEHSRRHRGEKRHKCSNCGKLYANGFDLKQHIKKCNPKPGETKEQIQNENSIILETNKLTTTKKGNDDITLQQNNKTHKSHVQILPNNQQSTNIVPKTISRKENNNNTDNISNSVQNNSSNNGSTSNSNSSSGSGMIIQVDNNGRVIPLQATAVHVVDYVPYYPSPEPLHIVMPPQTLVLTGYDNVTY
ncbi:uncharacterized protein LOC142322224 [Lycorma delicatula]|uniref:uncharacterized protein LOC142322224 n=1 Tax=Lycorma delicatula TaxID=130591 RepID=UPI003F511108